MVAVLVVVAPVHSVCCAAFDATTGWINEKPVVLLLLSLLLLLLFLLLLLITDFILPDFHRLEFPWWGHWSSVDSPRFRFRCWRASASAPPNRTRCDAMFKRFQDEEIQSINQSLNQTNNPAAFIMIEFDRWVINQSMNQYFYRNCENTRTSEAMV